MSDIVKRLREGQNFYAESSLWFDYELAEAVEEAADEIERLRKEVAFLRSPERQFEMDMLRAIAGVQK